MHKVTFNADQLFDNCLWFDRRLLCCCLFAPASNYQYVSVLCSALYLVPTCVFLKFIIR